ncbi:hypothetical protein BASA61_004445 [Batrachochytrium salamandrivorans]|nr:hypothetical protein BASA61_004445 [Batrachochytrium salamandrivorans]
MQFFYLLSFVVVASHAAALPQPAGLSEQYSSNVNADLASGLKAISHQSALNSQQDPVTLMSLKRRADSKGLPGKNSKYGSSPLPITTASEPFGDPFKDSDSGLGDDEYFKVEPGITQRLKALQDEFRVRFNAVVGATTSILRDVGLVGENFQKYRHAILEMWLVEGKTITQRLLGRALDPGVENVYTWLRGEVINGEADLDQRWLDGTVEHEFMGTRHDNRALAARLAEFL